ncbi:MAG: hypothetical protein ABI409_12490, partial [Ramlibacter sp.]
MLLSKGVAVADGLAAFAVLVLGQYAISTLAVRSRRVRQLVKERPSVAARATSTVPAFPHDWP